MKGVNGRILFVDLGRSKTRTLRVKEEVYKKYLGGRGLGAKILLESDSLEGDPLSPNATIVIAVGPFTGSPLPMNSRAHFVFKSPLTRGWGESSMGGSFPSFLKWSGYDAIIITGKSEEPVYLHVTPKESRIVKARELWGLDAYEAEKELVERSGGVKCCRAIVIGPAGENLVKYAAVTHGALELRIGRGGQAGRCGAGAVFGSKKLKGIAVSIEERELEVYNPEKVREFTRAIAKELREKGKRLRELGTASMIDIANAMKFLPTLYWRYTAYDKISTVNSKKLREEYLVGVAACTSCPVACGRITRTLTPRGYLTIEGPEYETLYSLGPLLGLESIRDIIMINEYADKLGLDTITLGNILSFVKMVCREKVRGELELESIESYLELVDKIAYRKDRISEVLGEGVLEAAKTFNVEEEAVHFRGLEPAGYDPRGLYGMYIAYATSPRGACHLRTMAYIIDIRGLKGDPTVMSREKIETIIDWEDWCSLFDSLTLCKFGRDVYSFDRMAEALYAVTGWKLTKEDVIKIGRRISILVHYIERNVLGRASQFDSVPKPLFKISEDNKKPLEAEELKKYLKVYYEVRGFNSEGRVSDDTLEGYEISLGKEVISLP